MDEVNTPNKNRFLHHLRAAHGSQKDYRARLDRPAHGPVGSAIEEGVADLDPSEAYVDRVRVFARTTGCDATVCQAVVVAALQTLDRVLGYQQQSAAASISLAQGDKMRAMVQQTEAMAVALTGTLSPQGRRMLQLCAPQPARQGEASWWFSLTETLQVLEEGMERLSALVYGQPKGAPARVLSSLVVRLLRRQHHALLAEADQWIS